MMNLSLMEIAKACNGEYIGESNEHNTLIHGITTDSRAVEDGCLFIPIKGAKVDGHDFISQVYIQGAVCVLSEKKLSDIKKPYILVQSTLQALKDIAEYYRRKSKIPVVGITGSVGKTSTKEMIASVLSQKYNVLKTQGNYNNEIGVPLTIFNLREEHDIAVLEMGINNFGEMHRLSKMARPNVCIMTNIGDCHLENLKSREGVLKAKSEMFDYMQDDAKIFLNGDDVLLNPIKDVKGVKPSFFGLDSNNQFYADGISNLGLKGVSCTIHSGLESFDVMIPIPGKHMVLNALAATAVGLNFGLTTEQIKSGIEKIESLSGRFRIIEKNFLTIIDDCYNASPTSMKASINVLKDAIGRKVCILGDMFELGDNEIPFHKEVGEHAGQSGMDVIICVGPLSIYMAEAANQYRKNNMVYYVPNLDELFLLLPEVIQKGDSILVKASHGMEFHKVISHLVD